MTNWYPGLTQIIDKGFGGSRGGNPINGVVIHHTANGGGTSALGYVANANSRNSHPTYLIQKDGKAYGIVHPDRKPYSTGGRPDAEAVTFEVDNSGGAPTWPVSKAAKEALAQIIAYHYKKSARFGKGIARNKPGVAQAEFFVAWHSQYVATACPGPDLLGSIDSIIKRAMAIAHPKPTPAPTPTPTPVVLKVVFDDTPDDPNANYKVVEVPSGKPVAKPADPVRKGYQFLGWFDVNGSVSAPYDFARPVLTILTLVAKFEAVKPPPAPGLTKADLDALADQIVARLTSETESITDAAIKPVLGLLNRVFK